MPQLETATGITGVRAVGIPVRDQDRALEFYTSVLGFVTRLDAPGAGTTIALVPIHDGLPAGVETGIRLNTTDADAEHDRLLARGVDTNDILRWPGAPPMFAFRDPDGNGLELVQEA
jgi:lactoylglutathione lyase